MKKKEDEKKRNSLSGLALVTQVGISMATPIILCLYIGKFIDDKLNTNGIITVISIVLGAGAGMLNLFKLVYPTDKEQ